MQADPDGSLARAMGESAARDRAKQQQSELQALAEKVEQLERSVAELTAALQREQLPRALAEVGGRPRTGHSNDGA